MMSPPPPLSYKFLVVSIKSGKVQIEMNKFVKFQCTLLLSWLLPRTVKGIVAKIEIGVWIWIVIRVVVAIIGVRIMI